MNTGVPRVIIHWLQSLELTLPYNYPKRDLADGRVVAEIFNHYYQNQINIDLLYSSPSFKHREDNWNQLQKFFKKQNIKVPESIIIPVLNCYDNGAIEFLKYIYTLLTNKKVYEPKKEEKDLNIPHYAMPTKSQAQKCVDGNRINMDIVAKKHSEFTRKLRESSIPVDKIKIINQSEESIPSNEENPIKSIKVNQRS